MPSGKLCGMNAASKSVMRTTVYFSGRVQGVGFRATVASFAKDFPLAGTVRNLPDGRVELVMDGAPAAAELLVQRLREHFGFNIRNVEQCVADSGAAAPPAAGKTAGRIRVIH